MLLHDDIGVCEDHAHDLDADGFKGCVACLMYTREKELKKVIEELKTHLGKVTVGFQQLQTLVQTKMREIIRDERFHYEPALVEVNAPLALIQMDMKARMQLLKEIEAFLQYGPEGKKCGCGNPATHGDFCDECCEGYRGEDGELWEADPK